MAYKDLNDLFQQVLGRAPDPGAQEHWRNLDVNDENSIAMFKRAAAPELAVTHYMAPPAGQTPATSTAGATPPYDPNGQPNSIANLYQNVLGRNPDAAGAQFWEKQFGGTTANDAQRQQFIGAAGTELSNNASQWSPQTQTYNGPNTQGLIYGQPMNGQPAAGTPQTSPMRGGGKGGTSQTLGGTSQTLGGTNQSMSGSSQPMSTYGKGGNYANTDYAPREAPSGNFNALMGKGGQTQGAQGASTNSATSGQPQMGQPNAYPNTVGMGDNLRNTTANTGGKGKGA